MHVFNYLILKNKVVVKSELGWPEAIRGILYIRTAKFHLNQLSFP